MKALVYDGKGVILRRDWPAPRRRQNEARVRVLLAGICNTDLEITKGYMGYTGVLGHEFVGRVEAARDAALLGKRVVGEINLTCGRCAMCRRGMGTHCTKRSVLGIQGKDGCFADILTLPARNRHVVPDDVPDECAVFTEPLAAACRILEQVKVSRTDRVAVLGDGKLGLLAAMALARHLREKKSGHALVALGRHRRKMDILRPRGIRTVMASSRLRGKFDVVVDCTGSTAGFEDALSLVRPCGTLVLKSTVAGNVALNLAVVVINEVTVVGSRCGPFPRALQALAGGAIDPRPLIDRVYDLKDGVRAMKHAARRGTLKILLRVSE